jgi:hypothetical protein
MWVLFQLQTLVDVKNSVVLPPHQQDLLHIHPIHEKSLTLQIYYTRQDQIKLDIDALENLC